MISTDDKKKSNDDYANENWLEGLMANNFDDVMEEFLTK